MISFVEHIINIPDRISDAANFNVEFCMVEPVADNSQQKEQQY